MSNPAPEIIMNHNTNPAGQPQQQAAPEPPPHPFHQALRAGRALSFNRADDPGGRTIDAAWLNNLTAGIERTIDVPIVISGAVITGRLDLRFATFKHELTITDSDFQGEVVLSFATFERPVSFQGTHFIAPLHLRGAHAKSDFSLARAQLHEPSTFDDMQTDGVFTADAATFTEVTFRRIRFKSAAQFEPASKDGQRQPVRFNGPVSFEDAEIAGPVYFNSAQFGAAAPANFRRIRINSATYFRCYTSESSPGDGEVVAARFGSTVDFSFAYVNGLLSFEGAEFVGKADFVRLHIDSYIDFSSYFDADTGQYCPTVFHAGVSFKSMRTLGGAAFIGVEFKSGNEQERADFESIDVGGHLLFTPLERGGALSVRVCFRGPTRFLAARVRNNAEFSGALFEGVARFDTMEVMRNLYFRPAKESDRSYHYTTFTQDAYFLGVHVAGDAEFTSVRCEQKAQFESIHVEGIAFFDNKYFDIPVEPAKFDGPVDFTSAQFQHRAEFSEARFHHTVDFKSAAFEGTASFLNTKFHQAATFTGAYFRQQAQFGGATFAQAAIFTSVTIDGGAFFQHTTFEGRTVFEAAHFKSLDFNIRSPQPPKTSFAGDIDLRGFTYELIAINEEILGAIFAGLREYNRQPYTQLEKVLRAIGQDDLASRTYLEQRQRQRRDQVERRDRLKAERRALPQDAPQRSFRGWLKYRVERLQFGFGLMFDRAQQRVVNYGVRPTLKLFVISLVVVVIGTFMFSRYGAVELREKEKETAPATAPRPGSEPPAPAAKQPEKAEDLSWSQAFGFSLNQFIPIVEIPTGSRWKPSQRLLPLPFSDNVTSAYLSYAFYATLHRLLGAILVPLGVAALTGLLRRSDKND
jgi:uncharacterized protein YjbI with pentapeptide repeats